MIWGQCYTKVFESKIKAYGQRKHIFSSLYKFYFLRLISNNGFLTLLS